MKKGMFKFFGTRRVIWLFEWYLEIWMLKLQCVVCMEPVPGNLRVALKFMGLPPKKLPLCAAR